MRTSPTNSRAAPSRASTVVRKPVRARTPRSTRAPRTAVSVPAAAGTARSRVTPSTCPSTGATGVTRTVEPPGTVVTEDTARVVDVVLVVLVVVVVVGPAGCGRP